MKLQMIAVSLAVSAFLGLSGVPEVTAEGLPSCEMIATNCGKLGGLYEEVLETGAPYAYEYTCSFDEPTLGPFYGQCYYGGDLE